MPAHAKLPKLTPPKAGTLCACGSGQRAHFGIERPHGGCDWMCSPCLAARDPAWFAFLAKRVRKATED